MIGMKEIFSMDYIQSVEMDRVPVTEKEYESSAIYKNDLLFARQSLSLEGAGKCSIVVSVKEPTVFESHLIRLRINPNKANPYFIYYYFKSNIGRSKIQSLVQQVAAAGIRGKELIELTIDTPSLEKQNCIAAVLSALDAKIENNNRINANLEAQAQALYKSWFVDFEPLGGVMPEDWKKGKLGDFCKPLNSKVGEREDVKVLSPVNTGQLMLSEEFFTKQVYSASIAKYIVVPPMAFAYNPARVNIGSLGMNEFDFDGCVSPVYVVFECKGGYEYFFDLFRRTETFKEEVRSRAIGGVRQTLNYRDFAMIECIIPSQSEVERFNEIYNTLLDTIKANQKESQRLSQLRDTLLPKLMKGEIEL